MRQHLHKLKRWVIKIGTSSLTNAEGRFSVEYLNNIVSQVVTLLKQDKEVILVSSGAIALGMDTIERSKRPTSLPELQACAAIGQGKLMKAWEEGFLKYGFHAAQILLTPDVLEDRERYANAKNTVEALFKIKAIPVVNENDTVATEEIRFGDNDVLAAQVALLAQVNLLVFLSDIDGLYLKDKTPIRHIRTEAELKEYTSHIHPKESEKTAGGMTTKLSAAQMVMRANIPAVLADGRDKRIIERILKGEEVGSLFYPLNVKSGSSK